MLAHRRRRWANITQTPVRRRATISQTTGGRVVFSRETAVISLRIFRFSATCAEEELLQLAGQVTAVTVPRVAVITPLPRGAENKISSITE